MNKSPNTGFTLIELMIVLTIVGVLMTMVGPLAVQSVEKAQAKQEMLSLKNLLRKVSAKAFNTGNEYRVILSGKQVTLYLADNEEKPQELFEFEYLFFQPQKLYYSNKGFVEPTLVKGTYRDKPLDLDLNLWINGQEVKVDGV